MITFVAQKTELVVLLIWFSSCNSLIMRSCNVFIKLWCRAWYIHTHYWKHKHFRKYGIWMLTNICSSRSLFLLRELVQVWDTHLINYFPHSFCPLLMMKEDEGKERERGRQILRFKALSHPASSLFGPSMTCDFRFLPGFQVSSPLSRELRIWQKTSDCIRKNQLFFSDPGVMCFVECWQIW